MKDLFEEYGTTIITTICGTTIITVFLNILFGQNSGTLKNIFEVWLHHVI